MSGDPPTPTIENQRQKMVKNLNFCANRLLQDFVQAKRAEKRKQIAHSVGYLCQTMNSILKDADLHEVKDRIQQVENILNRRR